jgi:uncharacterized tellurite resistance protein B-like protein
MGLFDKFSAPTSTFPSNEREAIFFLFFGAIHIDGQAEDRETTALTGLLLGTKVFRGWSKEALIASQRTGHGYWHSDKRDNTIRRCLELINPELREPVFMNLCALVLADDDLSDQESHFIEMAYQLLAIEEGRAKALVDAMIVLKRL